jgi:5'-nucleotidase
METQRFNYEFQKGLDPTGRQYYWTKHSPSDNQRQQDTDISVLNEGFVSITPMGYDLTDERHLANIKAVL